MAKKKIEKSAYAIAEELLEIRQELNVLKAAEKGLGDELKKRIKRGEVQDSFKIVESNAVKVVSVEKALAWAQKYAPGTITVNPTAARRIFLGDIATGSMGSLEANGFAFKITETLREIKEGEIAQEEYEIS